MEVKWENSPQNREIRKRKVKRKKERKKTVIRMHSLTQQTTHTETHLWSKGQRRNLKESIKVKIFVGNSDVYQDKVYLKSLLLILIRETFSGQRVNFWLETRDSKRQWEMDRERASSAFCVLWPCSGWDLTPVKSFLGCFTLWILRRSLRENFSRSLKQNVKFSFSCKRI